MNNHMTLSLANLRKNKKPIRNISIEQKQKLSKLDLLAIKITKKAGTGSNLKCTGARVFQLNQQAVHTKMQRKKPASKTRMGTLLGNDCSGSKAQLVCGGPPSSDRRTSAAMLPFGPSPNRT